MNIYPTNLGYYIVGLSTETKPTNLTDGYSYFIETDTNKFWKFAFSQWNYINTVAELANTKVETIEVELSYGRVSGKIIVNGEFTKLGHIVVTQSLTPESETGIVIFAGEITSKNEMTLVWYAPFGAPRKTNINFIAGA